MDTLEDKVQSDTSTVQQPPTDINKEKYIALYQARSILMRIGTMQERQICKRQLERMQKLGANY